MNKFGLIVLGAAIASLVACGDDDDHDHGEASSAVDACEHMADGPAEAVTAIDDMSSDAPDTGEHHTRWDIALVALAADNGGYVDLVMDEGGDQTLFFDANVPIKVFDSSGDEVAVEATNSNVTECAEVAVGHTFELAVGTYLLELGPTTESSVSMVVAPEGEHDHDHEAN